MRGELPEKRLRQIQTAIPCAFKALREMYPGWAIRFVGSEARTKSALRGLWDGWHLLCEAYLALLESEACWIWYSELRNPPNETSAKMFCRYYLDDAALRLTSSSWHMLSALREHLDFKLGKAAGRNPLLERTINALEAKKSRPPVLGWLRGMKSNPAWQKCSKYRDQWCHNRRPAVAGLGPILTSARLIIAPGIQGLTGGTTQPVESTIEELRPAFREAYVALLGVYLKVMRLMSPRRTSLRAVRSMLVPGKAGRIEL